MNKYRPEHFKAVSKLVEKGHTIKSSIVSLGISTSTFYRGITEQQRIELSSIKSTIGYIKNNDGVRYHDTANLDYE